VKKQSSLAELKSSNPVCFCVSKAFFKKIIFFIFFLYFKLIFFVFSDHLDVLMSKMIFLKIKKYIILMHFRVKNTLKSNQNHIPKHASLHHGYLTRN